MKKITKNDILYQTYKAYKKMIFEEVDAAKEAKTEKIKQLADLGKKIENQVQNSLVHLNAFMGLGIKTDDTYEFRRAVAEIGRIQKLAADYAQVITRAHEIAEGEVAEDVSPAGTAIPNLKRTTKAPALAPKSVKKDLREDDDEEEPEEDDAEVLAKGPPGTKHQYENDEEGEEDPFKGRDDAERIAQADRDFDEKPSFKAKGVPSKKNLKRLGAAIANKKVKDESNVLIPFDSTVQKAKYGKKKLAYGTKDNKWHLVGSDDRDYGTALEPDEWQRLMDIDPEKAKEAYLKPNVVKEGIPTVKDAAGQPIHVRDRVIQKIFDPKKGTYVWEKDVEKYKVEKIEPDKLIVHNFDTGKKIALKPSDVKRIGATHFMENDVVQNMKDNALMVAKSMNKSSLIPKINAAKTKEELEAIFKELSLNEYGVVLKDKYSDTVITEDVKTDDLKKALIEVAKKHSSFEITNVILK